MVELDSPLPPPTFSDNNNQVLIIFSTIILAQTKRERKNQKIKKLRSKRERQNRTRVHQKIQWASQSTFPLHLGSLYYITQTKLLFCVMHLIEVGQIYLSNLFKYYSTSQENFIKNKFDQGLLKCQVFSVLDETNICKLTCSERLFVAIHYTKI